MAILNMFKNIGIYVDRYYLIFFFAQPVILLIIHIQRKCT